MLTLVAFLSCQSAMLFRSAAPICRAKIDQGAVYFSLCGSREVQRLDGGKASVVFTGGAPLGDWDVENGVVATAPGTDVRIHDGVVYSIVDGSLRRGGEAIAAGVVSYAFFEDRLVFATRDGLYRPPATLLAQKGIASIAAVTADAVFVTTSSGTAGESVARLLRVPWSGAPAEVVYEKMLSGDRPAVTLAAAPAGGMLYIAQQLSYGPWPWAQLMILRDGYAAYRHGSAPGPISILEADEEGVTIVERESTLSPASLIERLCARAGRQRAVR